MEDRRTAIAVLVSIILIMTYSEFFITPITRPAASTATVAATAPVQSSVGTTAATQAPAATSTTATTSPIKGKAAEVPSTPPTPADYNAASSVTVETDSYIAKINLLGGRISEFKLKGYTPALDSKTLLDLVTVGENQAFPLRVLSSAYNDDYVKYKISGLTPGFDAGKNSYQVAGPQELFLNLTGTFPNGSQIEKKLTFSGASEVFNVGVQLSAPPADGAPLWLEWSELIDPSRHQSRTDIHSFTALDPAGKIHTDLLSAERPDNVPTEGASRWIALNNLYFMSALIDGDAGTPTRTLKRGNEFIIQMRGETLTSGNFRLFLGAKDFENLKATGLGLERAIDLGWFAFLSHPLLALLRLFYGWFSNYGLAIIALTLLIKMIFLPLNKLSFLSMKAMQDLQPEVKMMRERIKDPNQLNQEMMALYKRRGVNPMGGCLPILVQIPVFFGLYSALLHSLELRHAPFALWINDLSAPEALHVFGVPVPLMVILFGLSMFAQQYTTPSAADPTQRKIMLAMPVVFTVMFIIFPFPAGLVLYWLVNNLISIVQQMYLRKGGKDAKPFIPTVVTSVAILCFGYILTLI